MALLKRLINVAFIKCFICLTQVHNTNLPLMVRSFALIVWFKSEAQTAQVNVAIFFFKAVMIPSFRPN